MTSADPNQTPAPAPAPEPPATTAPLPPTPPPPPAAPAAAAPAAKREIDLSTWLSLAALAALLAGLFLEDGGVKLWDSSEAWSVFAIVCGVAQLAPLARRSLSWSDERAWTVAAIGVGGLALWWLLLVLPAISTNTAFAVTVAVAAAAGALWLAPGKRDLIP